MLMVRRTVLLTGLMVVAPAFADRKPEKLETGPRGGPLLRVGPYTAELSVWEHKILVFLYDKVGNDALPSDKTTGKLTVARVRPAAKGQAIEVVPVVAAGGRLRASIVMTGVDEADVTVELEIEGKRYEGSKRWKREEDRSRLFDGASPARR
jgi:hypothetical protein